MPEEAARKYGQKRRMRLLIEVADADDGEDGELKTVLWVEEARHRDRGSMATGIAHLVTARGKASGIICRMHAKARSP